MASANNGTTLINAAASGRVNDVKKLLSAPGIDVNQAGEDGKTPLYKASSEGHSEVVKLLLAAPGIDVNRVGDMWVSRLSRTRISPAWEGHWEEGWTPLMAASFEGHLKVMKLLLAVPGIRVLWECANGKTALDCARCQANDFTANRRAVVSLLEEVVDVKRTYAAVLLTLVRLSKSRSWSSDVAMHGLPSERAKALAARMRDTWPFLEGSQDAAAAGGWDGWWDGWWTADDEEEEEFDWRSDGPIF